MSATIGLGANLASRPNDAEYPATSLAEQGFTEIGPDRLLQACVRGYDDSARMWRKKGFTPIREAWARRARFEAASSRSTVSTSVSEIRSIEWPLTPASPLAFFSVDCPFVFLPTV